MKTLTRGERNIHWIESYCLYPNGPERGQRVCLTPQHREIVLRIYDDPSGAPQHVSVPNDLAAYLALLHTCGYESIKQTPVNLPWQPDIFTTWASAGPDLKSYLRCEGGCIVCAELGTSYQAAA